MIDIRRWGSKTVGDLMTFLPGYVDEDASLVDASRLMIEQGLASIPVVTENRHVLGMLKQREVIRTIAGGRAPAQVKAGELADPKLIVDATASLEDVAAKLEDEGAPRLAVTDSGRLVGVIT